MLASPARLGWIVSAGLAGLSWFSACVGDNPNGDNPNSPDSSIGSSSGGTSGGSSGSSGTSSGGGASSGGSDGGSSGASSGNPDAATACGAQHGCPAEIEGAHLQLWLHNDSIVCDSNLVTSWKDQSGHERNAVPVPLADGGHALPPVCDSALINTKKVVSFDSVYDLNGGDIEDKVLKVDLSFVADASFSLAVVHRPQPRRGGLLSYGKPAQSGLCADPSAALSATLNLAVIDVAENPAHREYRVEYGCNPGYYPGEYRSTAPELLEYVFSTTLGRKLFLNGTELEQVHTNDASTAPLGVTGDGGENSRIGRAVNVGLLLDTRYAGEIAEIIGYDTALSVTDRKQLEAYLKTKYALP